MPDPNPYAEPIQVRTVGELRKALARFTIHGQILRLLKTALGRKVAP